jgi:flagellar motor switch protein FliG
MSTSIVKYEELTGRQKVAILLMSLEVDAAANIFKELEPQEVEQIAIEISNLRGVATEVIEQVIEEYYQMMTAQGYVVEGGMDYALALLQKTFGFERAREIIEKIKMLTAIRGFDILKKADPQQLAGFLSKEHPQTIALIISHLPPDQSAEVLNEFNEDLRAEVLMRIATLGKVSPQIISQIEEVVDKIGEAMLSQNLALTGGAQLVASILNKSNNATAKSLLETIEDKDPNLAVEIKRLMFLFDDIVLIDDKGIQRILRDVDKRDLALALKVAEEKIRSKIFKNMSERAAAVIKEELEFMGPVKLKEVESAQLRIVDVIKRLEEQEEVVISGRGKEDVFV